MKRSAAKPPFYDKTLLNAGRLHSDSKLLADNDRAQSSIILGVLAIEELGKALITKWAVRNKASKREFPTHVEKQAATFALLSAAEHMSDQARAKKYLNRGTLSFLKFGPTRTSSHGRGEDSTTIFVWPLRTRTLIRRSRMRSRR